MERKSDFERMVELSAKLPWWACVALALASYFAMHALAGWQPSAIQGFSDSFLSQSLRAMGLAGQFLLPLAFGLSAILSLMGRWKRRRLHSIALFSRNASVLNDLAWSDFEKLVGEVFRRKGFTVSETGGSRPDGGVDLVLTAGNERYLVQCKRWRATKVDVGTVRELYGVMAARGASGAFVVSSGSFTKDADEFVRGRNIELIDHGQLMSLMDDEALAIAAPGAQRDAASVARAAIERVGPACPECGGSMARRVARLGGNAGKPFWGCRSFPRCRGTLPIDSR